MSRPAPSRRVVKLRAGKSAARAEAIKSPCHQHRAIGQQRRRVCTAREVEGARVGPAPARGVVQFPR